MVNAIDAALGVRCVPVEGRIEWETRFDGAPAGPRVHDLGVFGSCGEMSLFVGLEAKVDEAFGDTVAGAWGTAQAQLAAGATTNRPQRIQQLVDAFFPGQNPNACDVPYQLLTAAAGTLAEGRDVSVFQVLVFVSSPSYDNQKGDANRAGFDRFLRAAGAPPLVRVAAGVSVSTLDKVAGAPTGTSSLSPNVFNRKLHIIWQEV